jgi:hypothetical protein
VNGEHARSAESGVFEAQAITYLRLPELKLDEKTTHRAAVTVGVSPGV